MILILSSINNVAALETLYYKIFNSAKMSFLVYELLLFLNEGVHIIYEENEHHLAIGLCH